MKLAVMLAALLAAFLVVMAMPSLDAQVYTEGDVVYVDVSHGSVTDEDAANAAQSIDEIKETDSRAMPEVRVVSKLSSYGIPSELVETVVDTGSVLTLITENGDASFTSVAMDSIVPQGSDVTFSMKQTTPSEYHSMLVGDGHSYSVHMESDGASLDGDLGDDVSVTVPFNIVRGYSEEDIVVYGLVDGSIEGIPVENCRYFEMDGRGFVNFTAPQLMEYAVTYEEGSRESVPATPLSITISLIGILTVSGLFYWMFRRM